MSPEMVGVLGVVVMLILISMRVPLAIAMMAVSIVGTSILVSPQAALAKLGADAFANSKIYSLSVIPLFVMMGFFLSYAGMGSTLYKLFDAILGKVRAGLAMATIGASALFAAVCGSVVATTTTIASVSVEEMKRYNYDEGFAAGCAAVGGTLGILIPPSSTMVMYGALTEETIGGCLIAGIIPGILTAILLMITAYVLALRNPKLAPISIEREKTPLTWDLIKEAWIIPTIFLISIGGIYVGVFTPTEGGAVGAFLALVILVLLKKMNWETFKKAMNHSARVNAMTFFVLVGGLMFGRFITLSRLPLNLTQFITGLDLNRYVILSIIFLIYLFLGTIMDGMAILVIMTPIIYPIIRSLGFDGIWFAVLTILMLNIGLLTPPIGVISLITANITKVPVGKVFRGVTPFWITLIISSIIIIIFPQLATFLPSMMK
ncbi:TRAP transporter, DctM subunit [Caldanaerovirga acetigignens]|uniref:TRAP transporter, DctM subunit n=2 Tax=Caldanaerovirga acetigignens TaxID=447595 RepID=A0A1M7IA06_9FIRM|nr:TRAP transporter, DctM subunit [Caldanaerovirga acetigignens]